MKLKITGVAISLLIHSHFTLDQHSVVWLEYNDNSSVTHGEHTVGSLPSLNFTFHSLKHHIFYFLDLEPSTSSDIFLFHPARSSRAVYTGLCILRLQVNSETALHMKICECRVGGFSPQTDSIYSFAIYNTER